MTEQAPQLNANDAFIEAAERIRILHKRDLEDAIRDRKRPKLSASPFSQQAIWLEFPTYKRLLEKRAKITVPEVIVRGVATLLECNISERNILLSAAGYKPDPEILSGAALEQHLERYRSIVHNLTIPGFILNHVWDILEVNSLMNRLFEHYMSGFASIPVDDRNILNLMFDPRYGFKRLFSVDIIQWELMARSYIYNFRQATKGFELETWYRAKINYLSQFADFNLIWKQVEANLYKEYDTSLTYFTSQFFGFRSIYITESEKFPYPRINAYISEDLTASIALLATPNQA
ncbi:MAG TPA: hypothetical protein DEF47_17660 [Herpetosiphon sp.]|uniref:MmyB-like transcription regulator ligand binding domain-containing protein n=1 Tax=Herpetosiphon aurantiacus (strain ATCC 23779 / DSM 785 / 114-95) TaxID=316274 RepID=A9AYG8_HERA2|nr:hypothetical protein [Herpetosiphon sp.]ABX03550.1 hypothetical protein Haur_0902 [Herpetosiphon aurantiacus DSM 785]HBW51722.1 hypothetical protein [Herpetosiphon sp.]